MDEKPQNLDVVNLSHVQVSLKSENLKLLSYREYDK